MSYYCLFQAHPCRRTHTQSCHHANQALQTSCQRRVQPPSSEDAPFHRRGKPQRGHRRRLPSVSPPPRSAVVCGPTSPGVAAPSLPGKWVRHTVLGSSPAWAQLLLGQKQLRARCWLGSFFPSQKELELNAHPQTELTFSTVCFYTLKYSPLVLNLSHSGLD